MLNGAALYPLDIKQEGLAGRATWLRQEAITIYYATTSIFRYFVDTLTAKDTFPALRLIRLGGETVSKRDVELYQRHFSADCCLVITLASTETMVIRRYYIDKASVISGSMVPVGYAVEDADIVLLDEVGREVGMDCVGEIAVRSPYLTLGYWRQPETTRAVLLPDPTGGNRRMYRTGDLGLLRTDGCLEHLGRKDSQVKVRGHRIELTEVERVLCDHESIKHAVVVAHTDDWGDVALVAYLVPTQMPGPSRETLRSFVQARLPDPMVPVGFVLLEALPLTPSGKIDRRALPRPAPGRAQVACPFVAPRTPIEVELASIWADVLGLEQVGCHDPCTCVQYPAQSAQSYAEFVEEVLLFLRAWAIRSRRS